jgi:hypothetical protein
MSGEFTVDKMIDAYSKSDLFKQNYANVMAEKNNKTTAVTAKNNKKTTSAK